MSIERGVRFELLARLCPNATGADIRRRGLGGALWALAQRGLLTHPLPACLPGASSAASPQRVH